VHDARTGSQVRATRRPIIKTSLQLGSQFDCTAVQRDRHASIVST